MHRPALAGAPTRWAIEALEPRFGSDAVVVGMIIQTAVVGVCPPSHLARQSVDSAFTLANLWFEGSSKLRRADRAAHTWAFQAAIPCSILASTRDTPEISRCGIGTHAYAFLLAMKTAGGRRRISAASSNVVHLLSAATSRAGPA